MTSSGTTTTPYPKPPPSLPPEILAVIFTFAHSNGYHSPHSLINLGYVCKEWRSIIFSHPRLWTTLRCSAFRPSSKEVVEQLQGWFDNASNLPLSLKLAMDPFRPTSRELSPLTDFLVRCPRWESLHFKYDLEPSLTISESWPWLQSLLTTAKALSDEKKTGCWALLEELELEGLNVRYPRHVPIPNVALNDIAPNLQRLKIKHRSSVDGHGHILGREFGAGLLQNLRLLELDAQMKWDTDTLPEFLFRILSKGTHLETLTFLDHRADATIPPFEFSAALPSFPISNCSLRHLSLHDSPAIRWCLQNLSLPSLASLTLSEPDLDIYHVAVETPETIDLHLALQQLIVQSHQCRLTDLRLENTTVSDEHLFSLLRLMPSLENLELVFTSSSHLQSTGFMNRFLPSSTPPDEDFLPALRAFSYVVGAWHIPLTIVRLKKLFKTFVEDPRRWWPRNRKENEKVNPVAEKKYNRMDKAHLLLHRIDQTTSTIYSRGQRNI